MDLLHDDDEDAKIDFTNVLFVCFIQRLSEYACLYYYREDIGINIFISLLIMDINVHIWTVYLL